MLKKRISFLALGVGLILFWMTMTAVSTQDSAKLADQHFKKAVDLLKQIQYQDAIAEYEKVISLIPDSDIARDARYWIGQSYFKMGKHDEALSVFEKLIQDYPESAIAPVTHLMSSRVQKEKENKKIRAKSEISLDEKVITDSRTGVKYTKIWSLAGKKAVAEMGGFNISSNGKFLLNENLVIPVKDGDPFNLVDMDAWRGNFSPDCKKAAFYSDNAIWIVPVSPETGRPTGPSKKLLDMKFTWQGPVEWSPDNKWIVFTTPGIKFHLFNLSWLPDGKHFAIFGMKDKRDTSNRIYLISEKGDEVIELAADDNGWKDWLYPSPDGKWISYDSEGTIKVRSESTLWEVDFEKFIKKENE